MIITNCIVHTRCARVVKRRQYGRAQWANRRRCSKKVNLEATSKMKNKKMWNNNYKNKNVNRKDEIMYVVFVLYMLAALARLRDGASAASTYNAVLWKIMIINIAKRSDNKMILIYQYNTHFSICYSFLDICIYCMWIFLKIS